MMMKQQQQQGMEDCELQEPLVSTREKVVGSSSPSFLSRSSSRACFALSGLVSIIALTACGFWHSHHQTPPSPSASLEKHHKHHHGHITYQATLQKNNNIEYTREFTAPCDYGILVFNVGPAVDYEPYLYDIYQDAYVFSNNDKLCFLYPTYRAIQKGPFPWWVSGDPTSFDVPVGLTPTKISNRIVRPPNAKNISAKKGGDFLIMAHHKFYTPAFYERLKQTINHWSDDDAPGDLESLEELLLLQVKMESQNTTTTTTMFSMHEWGSGDFEIIAP